MAGRTLVFAKRQIFPARRARETRLVDCGCLRPARERRAGRYGPGRETLLNAQNLGEAIEVRVAMQYGEPTVLSGGCRDQSVGGRNTVVAVAAPREFTDCTGSGVCDSASLRRIRSASNSASSETYSMLVRAE